MISLFSESDYSIIADIWEKSVLNTHDFLSSEDFEFYKTIVPDFFPKVTIYIYEEDGCNKGFIGISDNEIQMLFVDPLYFRQGVGKNLLLFAINTLYIKKVDVNQQNTDAYEFYKKFGFKEMSVSEVDGLGKPYPLVHLEII